MTGPVLFVGGHRLTLVMDLVVRGKRKNMKMSTTSSGNNGRKRLL